MTGVIDDTQGQRSHRRAIAPFARLYALFSRPHSPEAPGPVDMAAIGDENDLLSIGRPRGRDVMVPRAVVVARQLAVGVFRESNRLAARWRDDEDVPAPVVDGRDERNV